MIFLLKKFFVIFIIIFLYYCPCFADYKYIDIPDTNLQIVKSNHAKMYGGHIKYGLHNKKDENNSLILEPYYDKITTQIINDKKCIIASNDEETIIYSPDMIFSNFLTDYYNSFKNIKFINYPEKGNIQIEYSLNNKKYYNILSVQPDKLIVKKIDEKRPNLYKDFLIDKSSLIYQLLNVSYIYKKKYHIYHIPPYIDEKITLKDGEIISEYKEVSQGESFNLYEYPNIQRKQNILTSRLENIIFNTDTINEIYDFIGNETPFVFKKYPQNAILRISYTIPNSGGKHTNALIFFNNGKKSKILYDNFDDFYFGDENLFINRATKLNFSYQNQQSIIVKKQDKWGIIDSDNNIKVPYLYDAIYPIVSNIREHAISLDDKSISKIEIQYGGQTDFQNIFFVIKDNQIGVINDKNEMLVPFEIYIKNDLKNNYINQNLSKEKNRVKSKELKSKIIMYTTLPLWFPIFILGMSSML